MAGTELVTERLRIRPLCAQDRAEFVRVRTISAELYKPWIPAQAGSSSADIFAAELEKSETGTAAGTSFRFVGVTDTGAIAVFVNLTEIVRGVFQNAYASWGVAADVARQGYASEAVAAVLDFAFSRNGAALHRVQANIIPSNKASIRLAERVGFRKEGLAERYLCIAGEWQDHVMFAKTVEEHSFGTADTARR
jgi:ribosomal-protein-alanine N-acetyltransferase